MSSAETSFPADMPVLGRQFNHVYGDNWSASNITYLMALVEAILLLGLPYRSFAESNESFAIGERDFLLGAKPFVIRSGEMHYPRIPREYCSTVCAWPAPWD